MGSDLSKTDSDCSETISTQSEPNNDSHILLKAYLQETRADLADFYTCCQINDIEMIIFVEF